MSTAIRCQLLTSVSLMDRCKRADLIRVVMSHPGCDWRELVEVSLDMLISEGSIGISYGITADDDEVFYIEKLEPESPEDEREYARACRIHRWRRRWWKVRAVLQFWKWGRK